MEKRPALTIIAILVLLIASACQPANEETGPSITLVTENGTQTIVLNGEITVNDVLRRAGVTPDDNDRVNPPGYVQVADGMTITVVRVDEENVVVEESIPFERRTTLNDGLPAGDTQLLQAGVNGVAEVTYRITYENGIEVARSEIRRVIITTPQDEVVMVGSRGELPTVTVNGTLAYLSGGNAWIIRQNSANRRPLTLDGGLDGRVFDLSADGARLLFTRAPEGTLLDTAEEGDATATPEGTGPFNVLWVVFDTTDMESEPIRIDLENILYAEWVPGAERTIAYTTAEPRPSFPGWQANNDLWIAQLSLNGAAVQRRQVLEPSSGGVYGWYGTQFAFTPDGETMAWAQPDAVGILAPLSDDEEGGEPTPTSLAEGSVLPGSFTREALVNFAPHNAYDFVWLPGLSWASDGQLLLTTIHGAPLGSEAPEDSPVFDLIAIHPFQHYTIDLTPRVGMWAAPQFSPPRTPDEITPGISIAYLQAIDPLDSVVSSYRLAVMDRDGSNRRVIFPPEGEPGLSAQVFAWSPDGRQIALVRQGNLFLVDVVTGLAQQLTADSLSSTPQWTP
jgi:hypothetical protein